MLSLLLSACGSDDSSGGSGQKTGLWIGTTTETIGSTDTDFTTHLLFNGPTVFILREDEGLIGTYTVEKNGHITMDTEVFSYATPDTDNNFYVGTRNSNRITLDSLETTEQTIFANFNNDTRSGSIDLTLDSGQVSDLNLDRVKGTWGTTDSVLYINDQGGIIGSATGCQWQGDLFSPSNGFLKLSIEREECSEFNQSINSPVEGVAFIDGEGSLHFLIQDNTKFLWQRFNSTTAATATEEDAEEEVVE
jgi:hypothetical protein